MNATYCLVCKKHTENNNPGTLKYKRRLMMTSAVQYVEIKNLDLFHKDLVYLIV